MFLSLALAIATSYVADYTDLWGLKRSCWLNFTDSASNCRFS